jgi:carbohydrate diacid regulator
MLRKLAQEIAKSIGQIIDYAVLITDEFGMIIGTSDDITRLGTLHKASIEVIRSGKPKLHDILAADRLEVKPGYTTPILLANKVIGTVAIAGEPEDVGKFIFIVKKQVEILLQQEILLKASILHEQALQNLIQEISVFNPTSEDENLILNIGNELGYDLTHPRIAVIIDFYHFTDSTYEIYQKSSPQDAPEMIIQLIKVRAHNTIKDTFNLTEDICTPMANDKFVILHAITKDKSQKYILEQLITKCSKLESYLKELGIRVSIGIGSIADNLLEMRDSYKDAWSALTIGKKIYRQPLTFNIYDLYLEDLISNVSNHTSNKFVEITLNSLKKQPDWDELARTISAWCEASFNLSATSKNLHIHKNTLLYRLKKIEQISGYNLRIFKEAITLYLALKINILNH